VTIADKLHSLSRINDLDRLLLGLDCLRDEVRDLIASKDAAFIDGVLGTRRDRPTNEELVR
jgi:hypothetical protein